MSENKPLVLMSTSRRSAILSELKVVVLAGGVGGAKMVDGLAQLLPTENLTVIVNTGDDFEHMGLKICPDLDTVMYTLAGVANPVTGWGRQEESWRAMGELGRLGGPDWFSLGDLDLGTHLLRTHWLREGETLTAVTRLLCQRFGVAVDVLPMSDQHAPTLIESDDGIRPFQVWFVKERWQPPVHQIHHPADIRASARVVVALEQANAVVIAPSNPFVSIDPILNVYPIREMVMDLPEVVVAITPIIGDQAVKGPAAKMMAEQGMPASARAVAEYYGELLDGFIYDRQDKGRLDGLGIACLGVDTWMPERPDRTRLARDVMAFIDQMVSE
jgi:LPPG:FO 2-phospho-L-lactate transferase